MDKLPQRKNMRLKEYDYSQAGYYFITICTKDRMNLFGEILVGSDDSVRPATMQVNNIGEIIYSCWDKINDVYDNVKTDAFCIMPNHVHGIIIISESDGQSRPSLPHIIQGFKSVTTRMCFKYNYKTLWQKSYHDHIIRNEEDYINIYQYIETNPLKWEDDKYYI